MEAGRSSRKELPFFSMIRKGPEFLLSSFRLGRAVFPVSDVKPDVIVFIEVNLAPVRIS
jgi:hypothetical protein